MTYLLKIFTANPMVILWATLAIAAGAGSAGGYAAWTLQGWRLGAKVEHAERERDQWKAQADVVAAAATACSKATEQTAEVSAAAIAATGELSAAAARLNQPAEKEVQRIETIIERRPTVEQGADCHWAWLQIEAKPATKAGAP